MSETPPPQFSEYPRPSYQQTPYGRPPGVYLDDISTAWNMVRSEMSTWVSASLIVLALMVGFGIVNNLVLYGGQIIPPPNYKQTTEDLVNGLLLNILEGGVTSALLAGMYYMGVKQARGQQIAVGDLFAGFSRLFPMVGTYLLYTVIIGISCALCVVPGIYMSGALAFVYVLVIEQNLGPWQAIARSYETLKGQAWMMFALLFVGGLIYGLGACACGIGLLFTLPIFTALIGLHYSYFFPVDQPQPTPWNPAPM